LTFYSLKMPFEEEETMAIPGKWAVVLVVVHLAMLPSFFEPLIPIYLQMFKMQNFGENEWKSTKM